jgi:hypothetical protein
MKAPNEGGTVMSIKSKVLAATAALTMVGGISMGGTLSAIAATPACGPGCIEVFSPEFGTSTNPGFVETVFQGLARVGQPAIMHRASSSDPAEDLIVPRRGTVSTFFAAGMVSAEVNSHYGNELAAQIEYAPFGVPSGLCSALAATAFQNEGLSLQPCSVPGTTVWIIDTADSPATAPTYFPIVNGSTTDFSHPYGMTYPSEADPTVMMLPQIKIRHLIGNPADVPDRQLWGVARGVLK